jgi:hypothetical protein
VQRQIFRVPVISVVRHQHEPAATPHKLTNPSILLRGILARPPGGHEQNIAMIQLIFCKNCAAGEEDRVVRGDEPGDQTAQTHVVPQMMPGLYAFAVDEDSQGCPLC